METEKSHDMLFATWRPRKARGAIQSECDGLRTRGADDVNPNLRAGEDTMSEMPQLNREARKL